jgi:hypothetical protein
MKKRLKDWKVWIEKRCRISLLKAAIEHMQSKKTVIRKGQETCRTARPRTSTLKKPHVKSVDSVKINKKF